MQEGKLRINFEAGKIKGIYINAGLEYIYKRILIKAKRDAKKYSNNPENGIKAIIWGTLYLESICNVSLKLILLLRIKNKILASVIWNAIKKIRIYDKFIILLSDIFQSEKELDSHIKRVQKLFEFRNKLVHFKDEDQLWKGILDTSDPYEIGKTLLNAPDSDIIQNLKGQKLQEYINIIEEIDKIITKHIESIEKPQKIHK